MADVKCPKCGKQAHLKRYARVVGTATGGAGGAVVGWQTAAAETAKKVIPMLLNCAGPYGAFFAKAMGGLGGAASGAVCGHKLGQLIDEDIIARYKCNGCGYEFKQ